MEDPGLSIELAKMDESENIVKLLLDNNASVNLCTKIRASPLYGAYENGHAHVL